MRKHTQTDTEKLKEAELVTRARQQDAEAFAELYASVYRDLYRFALYTLGNPEDAEDVVSDTVTDAYAAIHKLRSVGAFRPWIFRILTNKCRMILKSYVNRTLPLETDIQTPDRNYAEIQDVRNAFARLDEQERLILSLTIFAGYSNEESARLLHMKSGTLRSIKSRTLDKLETLLHYERSVSNE